MSSPNLTTEVTAFPTWPVDVEVTFNVEVIRFEDDSTQAFKTSDTKSRRFKLKYENQSDSEKASFEAFHTARNGAYQTFFFDLGRTGETDIKVRFEDAKISYVSESPRTWSWTCALIMVL